MRAKFPSLKRFLTAGFVLLAIGTTGARASGSCAEDRVDLKGPWGTARFTVEIADTPNERSIGLMHRESMAQTHGMLFYYEKPQNVSFWMRNTLIPLDMIFTGADGVVRHIHANARPLDETAIPGGSDDILAVLEINGGMAAMLGITVGSELRHPGFDQQLVGWPCKDREAKP